MTKTQHPPKETLYFNGETYYAALIADILSAKKSVDMEAYLFAHDEVGLHVADALITAAKAGVKIRILIDAAGSPYWTTSFATMLEKEGILTKVFHPFPWQLWNWSRSVVKWPALLKWIYFILKANSRNHRKVCIIDEEKAYVGSFNISKCHISTDAGGGGWRDTAISLSQCDLSPLIQAFESVWSRVSIKERLYNTFRQVLRDPQIRLNHTRHRRRILYKHLLKKIRNCRTRIWITNAYFVPDNFLLKRLKEAAHSGVDVRILLPKKSDLMMMPWATCTFYYHLLKAGVRIFEYSPSILHAKSIILDQWACVGSSNLNHRSLLHDLEADIRISAVETTHILSEQFGEDLKSAHELSLKHWRNHRPWRQRCLGRLVLYLKYWI